MEKIKYFIIGGAGFIGSNLVEKLLKEKHQVTVFDNFSNGKLKFLDRKNNNLKVIKGDVLDEKRLREKMKDHDFVFHLAANADIAKSVQDPSIDFDLGIQATFNILEAMRRNGIKKIAYSSGSGVYGDVGITPTDECFGPLMPTSMYGASKLSAEGLISAFCHVYDMQAWIFRFANVVGKNQTHGVAFDFIKKLNKNPKFLQILGDGKQSKSYIHVSDVINAMRYITDLANEKINVFNVATEDYITVEEIADIVIEEMKLKSVMIDFTGGRGGWKGDVPIVRFNIDKIHNYGWKAKLNSKKAIKKSVREMLQDERCV